METDGEGGGGEAERRGRSELGRLLEAIGSSEVLERRIPLIKQLEEFSADDLGLILQVLLASWIDSTCSGVSHCTLHRSILQVALRFSDLDITDYLEQFLTLNTMASSWCGKHLQWSAKYVDESQVVQEEEHDRLCLELSSLSFILSTKLVGIAGKCFTVLGLEVAAGEGGKGAAQEECVLNKADNIFPTLESMAVEVEPTPAPLAVGATPWSLPPLPLTRKVSRRCIYCGSEKTPRWLRGPDGPATLCNACGLRFRRGQLLRNSHRYEEASRRCTHCASERSPRWLWGPNGPDTLCNACGLRFYKGRLLNSYSSRRWGKGRRPSKENGNDSLDMTTAPWSLAPLPRWCTHCKSEKTQRWLPGPDGPGTLCNACGQRFKKGRLMQSNSSHRRGRRSSSVEDSAGNDLVVALGEAMPCGVGDILDDLFDQMVDPLPPLTGFGGSDAKNLSLQGSEMSWEEAGLERAEEEEEELEWLSNKDAFPSVETMAVEEAFSSVETMAVEVEEALALDALPAAARTKGRRRVMAMETRREAIVPPEAETVVSPELPRRRCTHCATEETRAWLVGPDGPYTLCNPCGILFKTRGRLLPEYRPANSPTFSRLLHSNIYNRALEMNRRNETSATGEVCSELMDGPANGPTHRVQEERRQSAETPAAGRATTEAGRGEARHESLEVPLLPERSPADSPAFSLVSHRRVLYRSHKSEQETFAGIRATSKARRAERAVARLAMDN